MPTPPPFSDEQLQQAAQAFAHGALAGIDPSTEVDERAYCGSGISSYDRVGLHETEVFRAGRARRAAFERCEELARRSRQIRHARAA